MMTNPLECCRLCPRDCGVDRLAGKTGVCGAETMIRVARAAPHHWEEPCISGTLGSGAVFFSYCSLGCIFCQNDALSKRREGVDLNVRGLTAVFLALASQKVHNINLVTPTHYAPQIVQAIIAARAAGMEIPIVYNCGGYESVETIRFIAPYIDVWMPDFKFFSPLLADKMSGTPDYPERAMNAIDAMVEIAGPPVFRQNILEKGVLVRHLVLPGQFADSVRVIDTVHQRWGGEVLFSLMGQYTPTAACRDHPMLSKKVGQGQYRALAKYAAELDFFRLYIQEEGAADSAYIPAFDNTGL